MNEKYGTDKVRIKIQEIVDRTEQENEKTLDLQTAQDITLLRLDILIKEKRYIEYLTVGSSLVEYAVKRVISSYEFLINSSLILNNFDTILTAKSQAQGDIPLGQLLKELKRFCKENSSIKALEDFNSNRIKAVHKIYELNTDITIVNAQFQKYVEKNPILQVIIELRNIQNILVKELIGKLGDLGLTGQGIAAKYAESEKRFLPHSNP